MILSSIYNSLQHKSSPATVNKEGICISRTQFQYDVVALMNLKFNQLDDTSYVLKYELVLVSPHCNIMFGIHSELTFKSTAHDHEENCIKFGHTDGRVIQLPYLEEKSDGCSPFIQVWNWGGTTVTNSELIQLQIKNYWVSIMFASKLVYLMGHDFVVYTDHKSLVQLKSFVDLVNKWFRWIEYLEEWR